jgi:hydrogenase maturation protease
VTIVGMGNPEMGDDGIGIHVAERLQGEPPAGGWPSDVELLCAERDPALAAALLSDGKRVLLVDAVDMKVAPGSWRVFSPADVAPAAAVARTGVTHTLGMAEVLEMARSLGWADRLRILGIQAGDVRPGRFLSPAVQRCVPEVLARIREEAEAVS